MNIRSFKTLLRKFRSVATFYIAEQTLEHLQAIRSTELDAVLSMFPAKGKLLEIGVGTGWQASKLESFGYDVHAIDLPSSNYREVRVRPVTDYDGKIIPFQDDTYNIVFSSNVLEHIAHIREFQKEIHRVLKREGCVLHILPSSSWRFWSSLTHILKWWTVPPIHGEQAKIPFQKFILSAVDGGYDCFARRTGTWWQWILPVRSARGIRLWIPA